MYLKQAFTYVRKTTSLERDKRDYERANIDSWVTIRYLLAGISAAAIMQTNRLVIQLPVCIDVVHLLTPSIPEQKWVV